MPARRQHPLSLHGHLTSESHAPATELALEHVAVAERLCETLGWIGHCRQGGRWFESGRRGANAPAALEVSRTPQGPRPPRGLDPKF
jgi:hypothetical protein